MGMIIGKIGVETPKYRLLKKTSFYEIREYPAQVAAVAYSNESEGGKRGDEFMGEAFMLLANYIGVWKKGYNVKRSAEPHSARFSAEKQSKAELGESTKGKEAECVAMTAPVLNENLGDRDSMTFILPAKYTMQTAPLPRDSRVHLEQAPVRVMAVRTFNGSWSPEQMQPIAVDVMEHLRNDGIKIKDPREWEAAYYNPPMCIPYFRTNEVMVPIAPNQTFY